MSNSAKSTVSKKRKIASARLNNIPDEVFKAHIMPMSTETESLRAELDKVKQQLNKEKASADYLRVEYMNAICHARTNDCEENHKQAMIDHYYFEISCDGEVIHSFKAFKLKEWPTPNEADVLKIYLATCSKNLTSQSVYTCKLVEEIWELDANENTLLGIVIEPEDFKHDALCSSAWGSKPREYYGFTEQIKCGRFLGLYYMYQYVSSEDEEDDY